MEYLNEHWLTSHSLPGLIHFVSSTVGLILGLGLLFLKPGSTLHKRTGYIFIPTLLAVNISALFIHEMGMIVGPFHYIIPFSLFSLFTGIKPFLVKMDRTRRLKTHIVGMVGAALGLWAAFCAELVARTPALSKFLFSPGRDAFWVATTEGFAFVFLFVFIIRWVTHQQFKRLRL